MLAFWVFLPFILVFSVAASIALLLVPIQQRLSAAFGGRPGLAAAVLVIVTTVVILVPVLVSLSLLVQQAVALLDWLRAEPLLGPDEIRRFWQELPARYPALKGWAPLLEEQLSPLMTGTLTRLAGGVDGILQTVLGRVTHAVVDLGLFLLMLFFLLRDGGKLRNELRPVSPFSEVSSPN